MVSFNLWNLFNCCQFNVQNGKNAQMHIFIFWQFTVSDFTVSNVMVWSHICSIEIWLCLSFSINNMNTSLCTNKAKLRSIEEKFNKVSVVSQQYKVLLFKILNWFNFIFNFINEVITIDSYIFFKDAFIEVVDQLSDLGIEYNCIHWWVFLKCALSCK